jgi:hypothetical protein
MSLNIFNDHAYLHITMIAQYIVSVNRSRAIFSILRDIRIYVICYK